MTTVEGPSSKPVLEPTYFPHPQKYSLTPPQSTSPPRTFLPPSARPEAQGGKEEAVLFHEVGEFLKDEQRPGL